MSEGVCLEFLEKDEEEEEERQVNDRCVVVRTESAIARNKKAATIS